MAQFLAVCWIAHVEFKVHRLRHGFSVGNALLLGQSSCLDPLALKPNPMRCHSVGFGTVSQTQSPTQSTTRSFAVAHTML